MGGRRSTTWWLWPGVLSVGCNALAGIDGEYVSARDPSAGTAGVGGEGGFNGIGGEFGASGNAGSSGEQGAGGTDGASGTEGSGGSAGVSPADAAGGLDGRGGAGGTDPGGSTGCPPNQKSCNNVCVDPSPSVGCSLDNCEPCPPAPAANSEIICGDHQCVAKCKQGFVPVGGQCVPESSVDGGGGATGNGGTAGAGGRGGSGGRAQCVVEQCPSCPPFVGMACCTFFRTCGCSFADRLYCI